jgi:hypothetical protein
MTDTWRVEAERWLTESCSALAPSHWRTAATDTVAAAASHFDVDVLSVFGRGTRALTVAGDGPDGPVVLKHVFDLEWFAPELAALRAWGSPSAPEVLASTADVALMRRVPGVAPDPKSSGVDGLASVATAFASQARRAPAGAIGVAARLDTSWRWARQRDRTERFWAHVEPAFDRLAQWASRTPGDWLLHGDLSPSNLLIDGSDVRWLDPFGCSGPPSFDAAYLAWEWVAHQGCDLDTAVEVAATGFALPVSEVIHVAHLLAPRFAVLNDAPAEALELCGVVPPVAEGVG